jgi:mRNA interferase RelE/StbE
MEIRFSREAAKFLAKLSPQEAEKIREKLAHLLNSLETEAVIPFNELDIKNLKGDWKGFLRMRVGKIRIIFKVDLESEGLQIYSIDFRGNVYR